MSRGAAGETYHFTDLLAEGSNDKNFREKCRTIMSSFEND